MHVHLRDAICISYLSTSGTKDDKIFRRERDGVLAYLALRIEEFDTSAGLCMGDSIVFAFLVVAHGVQAPNRGHWSGWCRCGRWCWRWCCLSCLERRRVRRHRPDNPRHDGALVSLHRAISKLLYARPISWNKKRERANERESVESLLPGISHVNDSGGQAGFLESK